MHQDHSVVEQIGKLFKFMMQLPSNQQLKTVVMVPFISIHDSFVERAIESARSLYSVSCVSCCSVPEHWKDFNITGPRDNFVSHCNFNLDMKWELK